MKYEWLVSKQTLRLSYYAFSSTSKICPIRSNFFGEHGTDPLDPPLPCSLSYLSPIFLSLLRSFLYFPLHPPKLTKTAPPPAPPSLPLSLSPSTLPVSPAILRACIHGCHGSKTPISDDMGEFSDSIKLNDGG